MKTTITQNERLQLLGLLTLARQQGKALDATEKAMGRLLESDDDLWDLGHLTDEVYGDTDIDVILGKMDITVEDV